MQILWDDSADLYYQDFPGQVGPPAGTSPNNTLPANAFAPPVASNIGPIASAQSERAPMAGVIEFGSWLQQNYPEIYDGLLISMPSAFVPEVALRGLMTPANLGALEDYDFAVASEYMSQDVAPTPATSWGQDLLSTINNLLPTFAQYQGQRELIKANISLAEKGKPLLDAGQISPQVNVGVSRDVQKLAMYAIGGLIAVGILMATKKK